MYIRHKSDHMGVNFSDYFQTLNVIRFQTEIKKVASAQERES